MIRRRHYGDAGYERKITGPPRQCSKGNQDERTKHQLLEYIMNCYQQEAELKIRIKYWRWQHQTKHISLNH